MTVPQKRFTEACAFLALAVLFAVFLLGAAQLDARPQPEWLVAAYLVGAVGSAGLSAWRFVLFFKS
jgi:hypothetical protein